MHYTLYTLIPDFCSQKLILQLVTVFTKIFASVLNHFEQTVYNVFRADDIRDLSDDRLKTSGRITTFRVQMVTIPGQKSDRENRNRQNQNLDCENRDHQ